MVQFENGVSFNSVARLGGASLRVAGVTFVVLEFKKWLRYGRGRGDHARPE